MKTVLNVDALTTFSLRRKCNGHEYEYWRFFVRVKVITWKVTRLAKSFELLL